jgi:uncharacterized membrane protein YuzA (DUF378 family)
MNFEGVILGAIVFIIIGLFHPIVIKAEYYLSKKSWPIFFAAGVVSLVISMYISHTMLSAVLGVLGFASMWSIYELFQQEKRVKKGWYPKKQKKDKQKL